jgi:hypothetical protein
MKKYIFPLIIFTLFFGSCAERDDEPALTNINASTLNALPFESVVLSQPENGANPLLCTVTWSATQFFLNGESTSTTTGPVSYSLEIASAGTDFADAQSLAVTSALHADLLTADINTMLTDVFGATPEEPINAEIRLTASYGEGIAKTVAASNTLKATLTPYKKTTENTLQAIYICGNMNGWDNTNTDFMMFRDDNDPNNPVYTYTGRIGADCYYKFCPEDALGSYNMYCDNGNGQLIQETQDGGAFYNATDGYKKITLNLKDMTYSIEDYDISNAQQWDMINFVGDFCGWGADNADPAMTPSEYDPHIWSLTVNVDNPGYGVKFRVDHSWDNRWCPAVPTDIPYGKAEFNPTTQDNNISIQEAGEYAVKFNDLTGHYNVMIKK